MGKIDKRRTAYTTGQVAKFMDISPKTIVKWFDEGKIAGYTIPMSKDRRITRAGLIDFLEEHGIPLGELGTIRGPEVLMVTTKPILINAAKHRFGTESVRTASDEFEAGLRLAEMAVDCVVVVDDAIVVDCQALCATIRRCNSESKIVVLASKQKNQREVVSRGSFDGYFPWPYENELVTARISTLLMERSQ